MEINHPGFSTKQLLSYIFYNLGYIKIANQIKSADLKTLNIYVNLAKILSYKNIELKELLKFGGLM